MKKSPLSSKYYLNKQDEFVIENYNRSKPFANFFPGIAGKYGIPMWVFYVNRGQGISSFGTKDKDHAIMEYRPANQAWSSVFNSGFRTFIKIQSVKKTLCYEPFSTGPLNQPFATTNSMTVTPYDLTIEELSASLGLKVAVNYFTIPQDTFSALVRIVTLSNVSKKPVSLQVLDGIPKIVPFGVNNFCLKEMSRTIEAWMTVQNLNRNVPFYKLNVDPADRPQVVHIKEGNFYLGFYYQKDTVRMAKPIVDPSCVFGAQNNFSFAEAFFNNASFSVPLKQAERNKTPCGFSLLETKIPARGQAVLYSICGNMRDLETLNAAVKRICRRDYLDKKKAENKEVIDELMDNVGTQSGCREFDLYVRQTYLDNIMRGGYPVTFLAPQFKRARSKLDCPSTSFYLYSRKHGDLERDYNRFSTLPSYFSQGNGNYRDVNQNRRCDVWFNPLVKDSNLLTFFNLIQNDGFNPLVVKGEHFMIKNLESFSVVLEELTSAGSVTLLKEYLGKPFTPGELIIFVENNKIKLKVSYDDFLTIVLSHVNKFQDAEHGEGFWSDHWQYNLDLLESFAAVFPEKVIETVFLKKEFTFFDNSEVVKPRQDKYVLIDGLVRQYHSVGLDVHKKEMIAKRNVLPHVVRSRFGAGEIYKTSLLNKLLCLFVNKMSSFDPAGTGIEMEADKPSWYDALNGLPGLFGSSSCETFELKRLVLYIRDILNNASSVTRFEVTAEILEFLRALHALIKEYLEKDDEQKDLRYWDASYALKEAYRHKTKMGFSGDEPVMEKDELLAVLNDALLKIGQGLAKAFNKKEGLYYTYFINEVVSYEMLKAPHIRPTRFKQKPLALFLEGMVHALRLSEDKETALRLHKAVKKSSLYDTGLSMYKVNASLKQMPEEIGRCTAFPPGWLENESIWLHMEYKYLLEILKSGLYDEYYDEFEKVLIPFLDAKKYGRSILENSSFIVSSAFADKSLHGNGFVARLSGSTSELIHMWLLMNTGRQPFGVDDQNNLTLTFKPALAGWLFDRKGCYRFTFFGSTQVTYHNLKKKNTFGKDAVKIKRIVFNDAQGKLVELNGPLIPAPYAADIRMQLIDAIDIYLD